MKGRYVLLILVVFLVLVAMVSLPRFKIMDEDRINGSIEDATTDEKDESCEVEGVWIDDSSEHDKALVCECIDGKRECDDLTSEMADEMLEQYWDSVDTSCTTDEDCKIKDIHGCCGYHPGCVNEDFETRPEMVNELCGISERMPVCGYPTINSCRCVDGECVGKI